MANGSWKDLYDGDGGVAIPDGNYEVEVVDARPNPAARQVWADFKVLSGPDAGKVVALSIYLPNPEAEKFRGQLHNFKKRLAGFDVAAALSQMDPSGDVSEQLGILADALVGQRASAEVSKRTEGEYAGTNQLDKTKPSDDVPVAAPVAAAPVAEAVPAPAPVAEPAPAAEPAMSGEVPF